jgi:NAD(P)-dependent dehydrogenase (short-subunit alcohol dehydrogenase family)
MATVMITGVNRGLGLEFIRQYAEQGWQVIGTCRDLDRAAEARALAEANANISLYPLDVTDYDAVATLAEQLRGTTLDVVILNAGVMGRHSAALGKLDADEFRAVLEVNVIATAKCLEAFSPLLADSKRGVIVGMGSFLGSIGSDADGGLYSYRAAKAGVHAIMKAASIDLREQGTIAIAMHPGWVATDMGGENAQIQPSESVSGMSRVIAGLTRQDSGRLLTYSGAELPW